eukprot:TRINITY_DN59078_c0_g2_i1.p2 TRINITY_DN59078_c0_g2~~TRINITY_DN59078_c0_g2_i1.p2  ORF type:complete len:342 (+),score=172.87 TRINITY_DN59078_c0_g2_i1:2-1027(+)
MPVVLDKLWASTGDTLVIIDRGTAEGFERVATARQYLLDTYGEAASAQRRQQVLRRRRQQRRLEDEYLDDDRVASVVAPCPHERPCPLLARVVEARTKLEQEQQLAAMQREAEEEERQEKKLVTRMEGEEVDYEYDMMTLDQDSADPRHETRTQRVLREYEEQQAELAAREVDETLRKQELLLGNRAASSKHLDDMACYFVQRVPKHSLPSASSVRSDPRSRRPSRKRSRIGDNVMDSFSYVVLRKQARSVERPDHTALQGKEVDVDSVGVWPRVLRAPQKRGRHIHLQLCAPSGAVETITVPKSSRREFAMARRAKWADLFPFYLHGKHHEQEQQDSNNW